MLRYYGTSGLGLAHESVQSVRLHECDSEGSGPFLTPFPGNSDLQMRTIVKPGDVFAIDLPDGRFGYVYYLLMSSLGPLVEVKSLITPDLAKVDDVLAAPLIFPPVLVGLYPPVKSGCWRRIGREPVKDFVFPWFRKTSGIPPSGPGERYDWELWDGERYHFLGALPIEMRGLEFLCVYPHNRLEHRIVTGCNEPYDQMI